MNNEYTTDGPGKRKGKVMEQAARVLEVSLRQAKGGVRSEEGRVQESHDDANKQRNE